MDVSDDDDPVPYLDLCHDIGRGRRDIYRGTDHVRGSCLGSLLSEIFHVVLCLFVGFESDADPWANVYLDLYPEICLFHELSKPGFQYLEEYPVVTISCLYNALREPLSIV